MPASQTWAVVRMFWAEERQKKEEDTFYLLFSFSEDHLGWCSRRITHLGHLIYEFFKIGSLSWSCYGNHYGVNVRPCFKPLPNPVLCY